MTRCGSCLNKDVAGWRGVLHFGMELPDAIELCLAFPGAVETTPFGPETLAYKVAGKIFAITDPEEFPPRMNLKCDPAKARELRERHEEITPGYHMNKQHWNTVVIGGSLPAKLVKEMIRDSYELVVASLPKAKRPGSAAR